jgi:hypothetical protein
VRFSFHPVVLSTAYRPAFSADVSGYLVGKVEQGKEGTYLFGTGPKGDLKPSVSATTQEEAQRVGNALASHALKGLEEMNFEKVSCLEAYDECLTLNVRPDLPETVEEAEKLKKETSGLLKEARERSAPLGKIKSLYQKWLFYEISPLLLEKWGYFYPEELKSHKLTVHLRAVVIGDVVLFGLPGEIFHETGEAIRENVNYEKLIILEEASGSINYVLPEHAARCGDNLQTKWALSAPGSEAVLRQASIDFLRRIIPSEVGRQQNIFDNTGIKHRKDKL